MKTLKYLSLVAIAGFSLPSCVNGWEPDELLQSNGQVDLSTLVINVQPIYGQPIDQQPIDDYKVTLTSLQQPQQVNSWTSSSIPELVTVPVGEYSLTVESGSSGAVSWGTPYYYCEKKITVEKNEVTSIGDVECVLSNLMVSVTYSDALLSTLSDDSKVTVTTNDDYSLDYVKGENRVGYLPFPEGSNTIVVNFEGSPNSIPVKASKVLSGMAVGKNYELKLTFKKSITNVDDIIDIQLIEKSEATTEVDNGADSDPRLPNFTIEEYSFDGINAIDLNKSGVNVNVSAISGIKDLEVAIISDVLTNEFLQEIGIVDVMSLTSPGEYKQILKDIGIPVEDQVVNSSKLQIPIDAFIEVFAIVAGQHSLKFSVTDNNGVKSSAVLTFKSVGFN